jgi:hypothetical protein
MYGLGTHGYELSQHTISISFHCEFKSGLQWRRYGRVCSHFLCKIIHKFEILTNT